MDWPNFIAYAFIMINIFVLSWRVGGVEATVRRIEARLSFLSFVRIQELQGKTLGEIETMLRALGKEAQEAMAFAEIAERAKRPWWHWRTLLGR